MIFFTSDTHFGHARIIELSDRPYVDIDEMDERIIENWNSVVGEDDTVVHLGDVALGPVDRWDSRLSRLNGHKTLIVGNHDRMFHTNGAKRERWMTEYGKWFEAIKPSYRMALANDTVVNLSHFPYDGDNHDADRFTEDRLEDDGTVLVHGHTHLDAVMSRSKKGTIQVHVGTDAHNYTPVSEQQVMDYIRVADDVI